MGPDYMSCPANGQQFPTIGRPGPTSGAVAAASVYRIATPRL